MCLSCDLVASIVSIPTDTSSPNYVFEYPGDRNVSEDTEVLEMQAAEIKLALETARYVRAAPVVYACVSVCESLYVCVNIAVFTLSL